ncbi:hypothetical protein AAK938_06195 [Aerococcaceae bacterium 50-4]
MKGKKYTKQTTDNGSFVFAFSLKHFSKKQKLIFGKTTIKTGKEQFALLKESGLVKAS